jgi:hypothetical protein
MSSFAVRTILCKPLQVLALVFIVVLAGSAAEARQAPAAPGAQPGLISAPAKETIPMDAAALAAAGRKYPPRVYRTERLRGKAPNIDGRLDDDAWKQGAWAGDYTQQSPSEGAAPTQPTELKILYDDRNLYFAIRAFDDPAKVNRFPGRRDDFNSFAVDMVGICFDSYNDRRTGFEFDLTAGGAKIDLILGNGEDEWDTTWDAVWDGKVAHDDRGWTAEFRIPMNQLRYGPQDEQIWGMHAWRWIARVQEESQWQLIPKQNTGRMHQLGELHGIKSLPRSRHVELLPHVLGKARSAQAGGTDSTSTLAAGGLDVKLGVSSNFTLDATVNPDFGQVEADPSVMNLTAFETFYEEKRPFFLEGRTILSWKIDDSGQLFHSRRIGEAPSFSPALGDGERADVPESTTILGAAKLTGKTDNGLSVAILQSVTQKETVAVTGGAPGSRDVAVEPAGSYTVARVHKDWGKGQTSLGAMFTSAHRWVSDEALKFLPTQATTAGIDFVHFTGNREWMVALSGAASHVTGDTNAITALQTRSVHYFQRAGATHLGVDSTRTSLSGHGGLFQVGRSESGRVRLANRLRWFSPGFEINDLGYLRQADLIANEISVGWAEPKPHGPFRSYEFQFERDDHWDFGGLQVRRGNSIEAGGQFNNRWRVSAQAEYEQAVDTRALRGGPALRQANVWNTELTLGSDSARRIGVAVTGERSWSTEGDSDVRGLGTSLKFRPTNGMLLTATLGYTASTNDLQYVTTRVPVGTPRWLLGRIEQRVWETTLRANLTLTPELTLQLYASPFAATGRYSNFRRATDTLASAYESRFHRFGASEISRDAASGTYAVTESGLDGGIAGASYAFGDPDFRFQEFRSNVVVRWEYKPGSSLFVVWSQGRTGEGQGWDGSYRRNWTDLWQTRPDNVVMVKMTYWLSR